MKIEAVQNARVKINDFYRTQTKKLTFPSKFKQVVITNPLTVYNYFDVAESPDYKATAKTNADCHTIIVDGLNFLMDMHETCVVNTAPDTQKAWGEYQQFCKIMMQQYVARSTKNVIFTAHVASILNKEAHVIERKVPVKGALKGAGLEAFFSVVVAAKKVPVPFLDAYKNDLLNITAEEEEIGVKHVFQTRLTKDTVNERITAPMAMWSQQETFIDNDIQLVMDRLRTYYQ